MLWLSSYANIEKVKERHFADADEAGDFALIALRWAVEKGILNGYGDGRLNPAGRATRAQTAQPLLFVRKFFTVPSTPTPLFDLPRRQPHRRDQQGEVAEFPNQDQPASQEQSGENRGQGAQGPLRPLRPRLEGQQKV